MESDLNLVLDAAESAMTMSSLPMAEKLARFAYERAADSRRDRARRPAGLAGIRCGSREGLVRLDPVDDEISAGALGLHPATNLFFGCGLREAAEDVLATVRSRITLPLLRSYPTAVEATIAYFAADLETSTAASAAVIADPDAMPLARSVGSGPRGRGGQPSGAAGRRRRGRGPRQRGRPALRPGPQQYAISLSEVLCAQSGQDRRSPEDRRPPAGADPRRSARRSDRRGDVRAGGAGRPAGARLRMVAARAGLDGLDAVRRLGHPGRGVDRASRDVAVTAPRQSAPLQMAEETHGPPPRCSCRRWNWPAATTARPPATPCPRRTTPRRPPASRAAAAWPPLNSRPCTALRFGALPDVERLNGSLQPNPNTPLATAAATHAEAAAANDGDRLDTVARTWEALGWWRTQRMPRRRGGRPPARRCPAQGARVGRAARTGCPRVWPVHPGRRQQRTDPADQRPRARDRHSGRRWLSNRQIADQLYVSVRPSKATCTGSTPVGDRRARAVGAP